jgi:hypothetical protein
MPLTWLKEHIVSSIKFWIVWFLVCLFVFMVFVGFSEWHQLDLQKETLTEARRVGENANALEALKDLQQKALENHEIFRKNAEGRKEMLEDIKRLEERGLLNYEVLKENGVIAKSVLEEIRGTIRDLKVNHEYLEQNRQLWLDGFKNLNERLDKLEHKGK